METILCACGCGEIIPKYDSRGRLRKFAINHQNRHKTDKQIKAASETINRIRPRVAWNKGKTYIHQSKGVYANKGSWNQAMRRIYPDECMRCGWNEATCDTHHITPKSEGGLYTIENGIILCPNCHRLVHDGKITRSDLLTIRTRFNG